MIKTQNIIGKKINRLTVLRSLNEHPGRNKHIYLECLCECGKIIKARKTNVINNRIKSCGCLAREENRKRKTKHGFFGTRLYSIWNGIRERTDYRCEGHSAKRYWKRGITICEEWKDFSKFKDWALINGYNDTLTIDRIDNNGNYCPENCRWVTRKEQARNTSKNVIINYMGNNFCLVELAEKFSIKPITLRHRLKAGKSVYDAVHNKVKKTWLILYKNKKFTLKQFCENLGLNYKTIHNRYRKSKNLYNEIDADFEILQYPD